MGKNIKFNNYQKEEICNKYLSGDNTYSIAKEYNCSNVTISRILKSEGVKIRGNKKFNKITELEICKKYKNGTHSYKLSEVYNCSVTAILIQLTVKTRHIGLDGFMQMVVIKRITTCQ
jgi:Mor family transcriptional regulator